MESRRSGEQASIFNCLRSRPVDPDVVCLFVRDNIENNDEKNDQKIPNDPKDPNDLNDRELRRRLTVWYMFNTIYPTLTGVLDGEPMIM